MSIRPDPRNANKGTQRGRGMLERSLRQYGAGRSVLADKNGVLIAGNKTHEVASELGLPVRVIETDGTELVVVKRTDLDLETDPAAVELGIADNRVGQVSLEWDEDVLAELGAEVDLSQFWNPDELAALLNEPTQVADDPGGAVDRAAELREKWGTERGQLWQVGRHRLLCGDSTSAEDVARLFGDDCASLVWTDPPYGVAVGDKNKWLNSIARSNRVEDNLTNDTLDEAGLRQMLWDAFTMATTVCTAGASWYVAAPAGPLHLRFGEVLRDLGIWRQTLAWVKNNSTFSPMGVSYHWAFEPIFYGWLPNGAHRYFGDRKQTTVWEIDRPQKSPEHPTMKPVELVTRAIEHSTLRDEIVYDLYLGSGTTMVAAEQTGRVCYGMEIEPKYVAVALERLAGMGLEARRVD